MPFLSEAQEVEFANQSGKGLMIRRRVRPMRQGISEIPASPVRPGDTDGLCASRGQTTPRGHTAPRGQTKQLRLTASYGLERHLQLVRGIGPHTAAKLRAEGVRSLTDLLGHPKFGRDARAVLTAIDRRETRTLLRRGAKDLDLFPLFQREEVVLIDIETTGFARALPLFLIGLAFPAREGWEIVQLFARGFEEEEAVLHQAASMMEGRLVCVSYNGKAFDEPFVRARFALYALRRITFALHVDLYHACKREFAGSLPDGRLPTVTAALFGWTRVDDVPGSDVPDLYYQYVRDGSLDAMQPIIEHNAYDVASLAWIFDALTGGGQPRSQPEETEVGM